MERWRGLRLELTEIIRNEKTDSEQMTNTEVKKCQFTLGRRVFILQREHLTDSKIMLT